MPEDASNEGIIRVIRADLLKSGTALVRRGIDLATSFEASDRKATSFPRTTALHKAMIAFTAHGAGEYFSRWRSSPDFQQISIDEHFCLVLAAYSAGVDRSDPTFRQNLAAYAIDPVEFAIPELGKHTTELATIVALPDTLMKTSIVDWEANADLVPTESTCQTLAHFVRGLIGFVRWHNSPSTHPVEVSETLAALDPFSRRLPPDERALLSATSAAWSAACHPGDFEAYLVKCAIKEIATGSPFDALDRLDFLLHWDAVWHQAGLGPRTNPKVQALHALTRKVIEGT